MSNERRCDILCQIDNMNLPIEIKGQWHSDIWSAASEPLVRYTNDFNANGFGVYLVLWFGYLGSRNKKNPRGWSGQRLQKTFEQMQKLLKKKYSDLTEQNKIVVIDLSKHGSV